MSEETKESNPVSVEGSGSVEGNAPAAPIAPAAGANAASEDSPTATAKAAAAPPTGEKPVAAASQSAAPVAAKPAAAKPAAPVATKPAAAGPPKPPVPKPEPWDCDLVRSLKAQYGSGIREASTYAGQNYLAVDSSLVYEILLRLRDGELFDYCVDITAIHYPKREAPFDVLYILYSFHKNQRIRIKTQIKDGEHVRSAFAIWPTANWLEREVFDMFGVEFDGHPELKRILMPEDWKGHPLRKDYSILQQDSDWVKNNIGIENAQ